MVRVAIVGSGTIGLSFAALHLSNKDTKVTIYDPRPDLEEYVTEYLPEYLPTVWPSHPGSPTIDDLLSSRRLVLSPDLPRAVQDADIVQEQGPENIEFKQKIWPEIEAAATPDALFWSSTSGIPASVQANKMKNPTRLFVVHPFNPPHVMPLLEIVPHPSSVEGAGGAGGEDNNKKKKKKEEDLEKTLAYWKTLGRDPAVLQEEISGFVANRLAFALFRQAAYLVDRGVASAEDIDRIVEQSMGPRWAVRGPFWSYHAGGGRPAAHGDAAKADPAHPAGLRALLTKIEGASNGSFSETLPDRPPNTTGLMPWQEKVCAQTEAAYGPWLGSEALHDRDEKLKKVLDATRR